MRVMVLLHCTTSLHWDLYTYEVPFVSGSGQNYDEQATSVNKDPSRFFF